MGVAALRTSSAKIGRNIVAVAVLLATSVNAAVITLKTNTRTSGGNPSNFVNTSPISADNPDF